MVDSWVVKDDMFNLRRLHFVMPLFDIDVELLFLCRVHLTTVPWC